jgi:outer membrane protein assembly factor BamB
MLRSLFTLYRRSFVAAGLLILIPLANANEPDGGVEMTPGGEFLSPPPADATADAIPLTWSPTENIKWEIELSGYGQSTPVIWEDQIYITTISGENKEQCHLAAYKLASGEKLWEITQPSPGQRPNNVYASRAAPTPVVDENGVVAYWEEGLVLAADHDGTEQWKINLVEQYGAIDSQFGTSSSLRMLDNSVFVWVERQTDPYLLSVARPSGEVQWKTVGLGSTSWSSPALLPVDGTVQLVLSSDGKIAGLDPVTGNQLWSLDEVSGNTSPSPVVVGDGLFLMGASPGRAQTVPVGVPESNGLIEVKRDGEAWTASWKWNETRATSSFASPLAYQGVVYFVNRSGVAYGIDLETGEELFADRIAESPWATPIGVGDRVYFFGSKGQTTVIAAGPEFKELSRNTLWEAEGGAGPGNFGGGTLYAGVVLKDGILIRRGDRLYRL